MALFDTLEDHGERIALLAEDGQTLSYSALLEAAERLRHTLDGRALVFCLGQNDMASLVGYVALLRARMPVVLLNPASDPARLRALIQAYQPRHLWAAQALQTPLQLGKARFAFAGYGLFDTGLESPAPIHAELAQLMTTSGSTGSPLLVRQSYANLAANTASIIDFLRITAAARAMTTLPMSYTYGLSIINTHLHAGASLVLNTRPMADRGFWQLLGDCAVTTFGGVPFTYEVMHRFGLPFLSIPSLRSITQAGGRLAPALVRDIATRAADKGIDFYVMYGQTEATARMAYLPPAEATVRPGSIGIPIPGGRFSLVDASGQQLTAANETGELVYSGPNVCWGYARSAADLCKPDEHQGHLHTGDLAYRDEAGHYYIAGRIKRFIKLFGSRVSLDEIEAFIQQRDGTTCACTGADDRLQIHVTTDHGLPQLRAAVAAYLGVHPSCIQVRAIAALPRAESGKISYPALDTLDTEAPSP